MKITALRLMNVRRFAGKGVQIVGFDEGVNVLCAANEFGKSTSFDALHALFFTPHTSASPAVKRLKPYSGGNPLVQVDIETADGRFRITKQFLGGKRASVENLNTGALLAQADEAERRITQIIRGGATGPASLLWVRQGVTGLQPREKKDEENERRVRESLLTSVQGEVEAITGGRRMSEIMAACDAEFDKLLTTTFRPKAGGQLDLAIQRRDNLKNTVERLQAEVRTLRDALEERSGLRRQLATLENAEEAAERRTSIAEARGALRTAQQHADSLKILEAQTDNARAHFDIAARELEDFRRNQAEFAALQPHLRKAAALKDSLIRQREAAISAAQKARDRVKSAEDREREARGLLDRVEAAGRARKAVDELESMRKRLTAAEASREAAERAEAELALIDLPGGTIETLEQIDIKIAGLRATEAASLPTVSITYNQTDLHVVMDDTPLEEAEERPVYDSSQLKVPNIGLLTIRSSRPASASNDLQRAENARNDLLAILGVSDLGEARRRQNAAQAKSTAIERLRIELSLHAPDGLARLREEVAQRDAAQFENMELEADPDAAREACEQASKQVETARNNARASEHPSDQAKQAVADAEIALAEVTSAAGKLEVMLGLEAERPEREAELALKHAEKKSALESIEAELKSVRQSAPDLETVEAVLRRHESAATAAADAISTCKQQLAGLDGQITTLSSKAVEEDLREAQEAFDDAAQRAARFVAEGEMLRRLKTVLQESRSAARDLYLQPVLAELKPLLHMLFDDVTVVFDEETLLPKAIRREDQEEEIDRLSGGMREQLSVLTRLAFARLLARDGRPAPVILDDALVYSDDDRIERMFNALHRQAAQQQIIVFSCRQRAFAKLGGNVLRMENWTPS